MKEKSHISRLQQRIRSPVIRNIFPLCHSPVVSLLRRDPQESLSSVWHLGSWHRRGTTARSSANAGGTAHGTVGQEERECAAPCYSPAWFVSDFLTGPKRHLKTFKQERKKKGIKNNFNCK